MINLADAYSEAHLDLGPLSEDGDEATARVQQLAQRWEEILNVGAKITADSTAASQEISRKTAEWEEQLSNLVITITANTADASAELGAFESYVQEVADTTVTVTAEADTVIATVDLEAAVADWEGLVAAPLTATPDMDTAPATGTLAASIGTWEEMVANFNVTPGFDGSVVTVELAASVAEWEALGRFDVDVGVDFATADAKVAAAGVGWRRLLGVEVTIDQPKLEQNLRRTGARLRGAAADWNDVLNLDGAVDIDIGGANTDVAGFLARWEGALDLSSTVTVDTGKAATELLEFSRDLDAIDGQSANVRVDVDAIAAALNLEQIQSLTSSLDGRTVNIAVNIDSEGTTDDAARVAAAIAAFDAQTATIRMSVDSGLVLEELAEISALIDRICVGCVIGIDVDLGDSLEKLAALNAAVAAACQDQTVRINVDESRTTGPIDDVIDSARRLSDETKINLDVGVDHAAADTEVVTTSAGWRTALDDALHATAQVDVPESVFRNVLGLESLLGSVPDDVRTTFSGNTEEVIAEVSTLRVLIEQLDQKSIDIAASVSANAGSIAAAAAEIEGGIPDSVSTTIGVDLADLRARLTAATAEFAAEHEIWQGLAQVQTHLGIDSAEATAEMEAWHVRSERLADIKADLEVQVSDAIAKLTAAETLIDGMDGRNIDIGVDVNGDEFQRLLASLAGAPDEIDALTDAAQGLSTVLADLQRNGNDIEFTARVNGIPEALAGLENLERARINAQRFALDVLDVPTGSETGTPDLNPTGGAEADLAAVRRVNDRTAVLAAVQARKLAEMDRAFKRFKTSGTGSLLDSLGGERTREDLVDMAAALRRLGFEEAAAEAKTFADQLRDIEGGTEGRKLNFFQRLGKSARDTRLGLGDLRRELAGFAQGAKDSLGNLGAPIDLPAPNSGLIRRTPVPDVASLIAPRVGPESVAPQLRQFATDTERDLDVVGSLDLHTDEAKVALAAFMELTHETVKDVRMNVDADTGAAAAKVRRSVGEMREQLATLRGTITIWDGPAGNQVLEFVERMERRLQFSPDLDAAGFEADLERLSAQTNGALDILATVELEDTAARRELDLFVDQERERLSDLPAKIGVNNREAFAELRESVERMKAQLSRAGVDVPLGLDAAGAFFEADAVVSELKRTIGDIDVQVTMQGKGAEANAFRIARLLNRILGKQNVDIDLGTKAALANAGIFKRLVDRVLGSLTLDIDADTAGASAHVLLFRQFVQRLLGNVTMNIDTKFPTLSLLSGVVRSATSTIGSSFSAMGRNVRGTFAGLASSAIGSITAITDFAKENLSALGPIVAGVGKAFGIFLTVAPFVAMLAGALAALVPLLLGLVGLAGGFITLAAGMSLAAGAAGVLGIALNKDLLAKVTDGLSSLKANVAAITRPIGESLIANFLNPFLGAVTTLVQRAAPLAELFINPIATAALAWLNEFSRLLTTVDASEFLSGFANGIAGLITTFAQYLEPFLGIINRLNGPAFAGFQALVQIILDLGIAFEPVLAQIFNLLTVSQGPLTDFGIKAAEVFTQLLTGLNGFIASPMWTQFVDFLGFAFSAFEKFMKGLVEGFVGAEDRAGGFTKMLGTIKVVLSSLIVAAPVIGGVFNILFAGLGTLFKGVLLIVQGVFRAGQIVADGLLLVLQAVARLAQGAIKSVLVPVQQVLSFIGLALSSAVNLVASALEALPDAIVPDGWISGLRSAQGSIDGFRDGVDKSFSDLFSGVDQKAGGFLDSTFTKVDKRTGEITGRLSGLFTAIDTGVISDDLLAATGGVGEFGGEVDSATGLATKFSDSLGVGAEALVKLHDAGQLGAEGVATAGTAAIEAGKQFESTTKLLDIMREKYSKPLELEPDFSGTKIDIGSLIQYDPESTDADGVVTPGKLTKGIQDAIDQAGKDAQQIVERQDFVKKLRFRGLDDLAEIVETQDGPALEAIMAEIGDAAGRGAAKMEADIDAASAKVAVALDPIQAAVDKAQKELLLGQKQQEVVFALENAGLGAVAAQFLNLKPEDLEAAFAKFDVVGVEGYAALETQLDSIQAAGIKWAEEHDPIAKIWETAGKTPGAQAGLLGQMKLSAEGIGVATGQNSEYKAMSAQIAETLKAGGNPLEGAELAQLANDALDELINGNKDVLVPLVAGEGPKEIARKLGARLAEKFKVDPLSGTQAEQDLDAQLDRIQELVKSPVQSAERDRWIAIMDGTATNLNTVEAQMAAYLEVRRQDGLGNTINPDGSIGVTGEQAGIAGAAETSAYAAGLTSKPEIVQNAAKQMVDATVNAIFAAVNESVKDVELKGAQFTNAVVAGLSAELEMVKPIFAVLGFQLVDSLMDGMVSPTALGAIDTGAAEAAAAVVVAYVSNLDITIETYKPEMYVRGQQFVQRLIDGITETSDTSAGAAAASFFITLTDALDTTAETNKPLLATTGFGVAAAMAGGINSPLAVSTLNNSVITMFTAAQIQGATSAPVTTEAFKNFGIGIPRAVADGITAETPRLTVALAALGFDLTTGVVRLYATTVPAARNLGVAVSAAIISGVNAPAIGIQIGAGLSLGMSASLPLIVAQAQVMAMIVANTLRGEFVIKSPSRVTHDIGVQVAMGLSEGIAAGQSAAVAAAEDMANAVAAAATPALNGEITGFIDQIVKEKSGVLDFTGLSNNNTFDQNNQIGQWVDTRSGQTVGYSQFEDGRIFRTMEDLLAAIAAGQQTRPTSDIGAVPALQGAGIPTSSAIPQYPESAAGGATATGQRSVVREGSLVNIEHMDVHTTNAEDVPDALFRQVEPAAWRAGAWGM